jgi:hypothetical protein
MTDPKVKLGLLSITIGSRQTSIPGYYGNGYIGFHYLNYGIVHSGHSHQARARLNRFRYNQKNVAKV